MITSNNGAYFVAMQPDGNFGFYKRGSPNIARWTTNTQGNPHAFAAMQPDGNLVVYSADSPHVPLWPSQTDGHPGAYLVVQDDGNLVIYSPSGENLWQTGPDPSAPAPASTTTTSPTTTATTPTTTTSPTTTTTPTPPAPSPGSGVGGSVPGDTLANGLLTVSQRITSANGSDFLGMQPDGNLVLYTSANLALWSSGTDANPGAFAAMQPDGNLVVYSASHVALWQSHTDGNPGAHLVVQGDGNLVIYSTSGPWVWQTGTSNPASTPTTTTSPSSAGGGSVPKDSLASGGRLNVSERITSQSGSYFLGMQPDGNLVLYQAPNTALWWSDTSGHPGAIAVMQSDGNLVVYSNDSPRVALWQSHTDGNPDAHLVVQDDGNLVIYTASGPAVWSSQDDNNRRSSSPVVTLAQGPIAPSGYRYAVTLDGFPANDTVTISCRDSVDPTGFLTFTMNTDGSGHAYVENRCYSGDGPDHWVVANGSYDSNHVQWGHSSAVPPASPPAPSPTPPVTVPAPVVSKCAPYIVIDARGSGEQGLSPPGSAFLSELRNLLKPARVAVIPNPYPAVGWTTFLGAFLQLPLGYYQSVVTGKSDLRALIDELATGPCPNSKIILTGYSQGAQVTGDVFQTDSHRDVVGAVLFGDPYFNSTDPGADRGNFIKYIDGNLGTRPVFTAGKRGHVLSYCHRFDPVCQGGALTAAEALIYRFSQHNNYASLGEPQQAAAYFNQTLLH